MPFCPTCRTEHAPGAESCADCGSALVAALPPAPEPQDLADEDLVPVYEAYDQLSAVTAASLLESEGIESVTQSRQMPMYDGVALMQNPVWGTVMVLARDADRARGIIEGFMAATPESEPAAPGAGDGVDAG